jgi:long-chain acyl-CoA synthetase
MESQKLVGKFREISVKKKGGITSGFQANSEVKVKLEDVPELGFFVTDKPYPRGEVCVKSPFMSDGYYGDDELTKQSFIDGWFHTGDIGVIKSNGRIEIIDRKKHIFKVNKAKKIVLNLFSCHKENLFLQKMLRICILASATL